MGLKGKYFLYYLLILYLSICSCSNSNAKNKKIGGLQKPSVIELYRLDVAYQVYENWGFKSVGDNESSKETSLVFKIMPNGEITNIFFVKRSGDSYLDESSLKAIKKTSPTKPFPEGIDSPYIEMGLRFTNRGAK